MIHWFIKHPTAVPEVPDSCTAILSPCVHPFPLFLETNTCHIFWHSFIVNNRVWIAWIKVIHANMLIPCNKQKTDTLVTQHIDITYKLMFRQGSITMLDVLKSITHSETYSPKLCHNNWYPPQAKKWFCNIPCECGSCCTGENGKWLQARIKENRNNLKWQLMEKSNDCPVYVWKTCTIKWDTTTAPQTEPNKWWKYKTAAYTFLTENLMNKLSTVFSPTWTSTI